MKICPMCGHENADEEIFCEVCLTNIREVPSVQRAEPVPQEPVEYRKICPSCGAENAADALRCVNCGAFLTQVERSRTQEREPAPSMKLIFVSGAELYVSEEGILLGQRYQDETIWRNDPYVSGAHLRLRYGSRGWEAENLSGNGTRLDGRVLESGWQPVGNGARLRAGRTEFTAQIERRRRVRPLAAAGRERGGA